MPFAVPKIPKSLARCADMLYETRQERLLLSKDEVDKRKELENRLRQYLIDNLPKGEASGIAGKVARVSILKRDVPKVDDWEAVYRFVLTEGLKHLKKKDGRELELFALFQRTIVDSMVEELWENNVEIPGVSTFGLTTVSVSRV